MVAGREKEKMLDVGRKPVGFLGRLAEIQITERLLGIELGLPEFAKPG